MKKFCLIVFAFVMIFFIAGCDGSREDINGVETINFAELEDDLGRKVILKDKPERIAVTSASFLEPIHEIGGNIVARPDSKNKTPDWAKDIPSIGQVYNIDVERLLSCDPDIVIINKGMNEKIIDILEKNKIITIVMSMKTLEEVHRGIQIFAKLNGNVEKGEELNKKIDNDIADIVNKVPKEIKNVAILHVTAQGINIQSDESIAGNIAKMFSWKNVASNMTFIDESPDTVPYSLEKLATQNPEIIFITSMGNLEEIKRSTENLMKNNESWQAISAAKNNKVYFLPQDLFLLSPGLHYPEAVKKMAELVYPDNF